MAVLSKMIIKNLIQLLKKLKRKIAIAYHRTCESLQVTFKADLFHAQDFDIFSPPNNFQNQQ